MIPTILNYYLGVSCADLCLRPVAFDATNLILYVNISQIFRIWFVPFYRAPVTLTTVLHLVPGHDVAHTLDNDKYFIRSQEDLYQTDEWIKFLLPFHIGVTMVGIWQWIATLCCIVGANVFGPLSIVLSIFMPAQGEGSEMAKPLLGESGVEERRDSKAITQGPERRVKRIEVDEGLLKEMEVDEGTVRVKERPNGKTGIREMERKANLGEAR